MHEEHCNITERERSVARLLVREPNIVSVARELAISPYTVRSHVYDMNLKTGTQTTHGLVSWARKHEICCCA